MKMKAVAIVDANKVELVDKEIPDIGDNRVLLKVHTSMLCTWEQRVFTRLQPFPLPYIGGHEFSGEIAAVGKNLDSRKYPIGAKASARTVNYCGECESCRRGASNMCEGYCEESSHGGLAEYVAVDPDQLYIAKEEISFERLCFAEPLGCVITGFDKLGLRLGEDVVIIGAGIMGILNIFVAKMQGLRVIVSEPDENRREYAKKMGADIVFNPETEEPVAFVRKITHGKGAEAVIDCVTFKAVAEQGIMMLATTGTFMMFGKAFPDGKITIDINYIHDHDLRVTGTMSVGVSAFNRSVHLLEKGIIKPEECGLLTAVYDKEEAQKAFEEALKPTTFRVGIRF